MFGWLSGTSIGNTSGSRWISARLTQSAPRELRRRSSLCVLSRDLDHPAETVRGSAVRPPAVEHDRLFRVVVVAPVWIALGVHLLPGID